MPERILIAAAERFAEQEDCSQVVILARDAENRVHVVTYGRTIEDCRLAAEAGNNIKRIMGWPEKVCRDAPARVKKAAKDLHQWQT